MRQLSLGVLVVALLGLGSVTSAGAQVAAAAQRPDSTIDDARLNAYTKAFAAIAVARDSAHAQLALPRNKTDENQRELREKLKKQIDQVLREQNLTQEEYTRITYLVSTDQELRKRFDEMLARVAGKTPDTR